MFAGTSPVAVVQPYYQCRNTAKAALANSVGNAAGTAGIVAGMFMLLAGIFFRKIHNRRVVAHALRKAQEEKELLENGGESLLTNKIALLTSRESRQIDVKVDDKTMSAVFDTLRSVVQLANDQQETLLRLQKQSDDPYLISSVKEVPNLVNLQVNFKKLIDIVEFDYNESHLTNISKAKGTPVVNDGEESKSNHVGKMKGFEV